MRDCPKVDNTLDDTSVEALFPFVSFGAVDHDDLCRDWLSQQLHRECKRSEGKSRWEAEGYLVDIAQGGS